MAKRTGGYTRYPVVTDAGDLAWLANQNTIAFHIWSATATNPANPDWLVLDLDPPVVTNKSDDPVAQAQQVALSSQQVLSRFDLDAFPVTTGSSGFHLWIPVDTGAGYDHEQLSLVSRALAGLIAAAEPELATVEFLVKRRQGRVFVDWLRALRGATVIAPLSVRARPQAPVATPIGWDEVSKVRPDQWTVSDVEEILKRRVPQAAVTERFVLPIEPIEKEARRAGVDLDTPFDRFGRS